MTLGTRTLVMVLSMVVAVVLVTAAVLGWTTRRALLAEAEANGVLIARLLGGSAEFARQITADVEEAIAQQMVVEATIASHLVAIAEQAGVPAAVINRHLKEIADATVLDEFWITDERGRAYLRNMTAIDFTFDPDAAKQPQAHVFWPLLTGSTKVVVQEARRREVDDQVFKYVAVAGRDRPRIVQVGYQAAFLEQLGRRVGLTRLVDDLVRTGDVTAIRVVDPSIATLAFSAVPGPPVPSELSEEDKRRLRAAVHERRALSALDGWLLKVMAPIQRPDGAVVGATLVQLPTDRLRAALRTNLEFVALVALVTVLIGTAVSIVLARRVTQPVSQLTAAAQAVETGDFTPEGLDATAARRDELGRLGRVFQTMAGAVYARERDLRRQVQELQVEVDEVKKARQVAEITETDYFQELRRKGEQLRGQRGLSRAPEAS